MLPTMINPEWSTMKRLMFLKQTSGSAPVEATATGNPLAFLTDIARPLKSLLIPFTPKQSGTGDPSPSNIRPILPWNGLTVFGGGKNMLDDTKRVKNNTNVSVFIGQTVTTDYPLFLKAGEYTISAEFDDGYHCAMYYKEQNENQVQIWSSGYTIITALMKQRSAEYGSTPGRPPPPTNRTNRSPTPTLYSLPMCTVAHWTL